MSAKIKARTTGNAPKIIITQEEDIPVEVVKKKSYSWIYVILGVLVLGGVAGGLGGAGGGGGDDKPKSGDDGDGDGDSGEVTVTW